MKKLFLFAAVAVLTLTSVNAQMSFSHSLGGKFFTISGEGADYSSIGALYSPRLNFAEVGDNGTVSVGTHIGLAFEGNSRDGSSFVYDIPLVVEYNFGQASNNDNDSGFGFYVGGGYGIHNSSSFTEAMSGPVASAGVRFVIADRPFDVNFSYLIGSGDFKDYNLIGVGLQYSLGL